MLSVKAALAKLKADCSRQKDVVAAIAQSEKQSQSENADEHWQPFRVALQPQHPPKVRESALDLVQKMLACHQLRGAKALPAETVGENSFPPLLIDEIVQQVCQAAQIQPTASAGTGAETSAAAMKAASGNPENNVHVQIVKVLLTSVTASSSIKTLAAHDDSQQGGGCEVHEATLVKALQCIVNIWLFCGHQSGEVTARAGLLQICHHTFTAMERLCRNDSQDLGPEQQQSVFLRDNDVPMIKEPSADNNPYKPATLAAYRELVRRDALMLYKFLCRLSMKVDKQQADAPQPQPADELSLVALRARSFGLEMMLSVITNSGQSFHSQAAFMNILRTQSTLSISKNSLLQNNHANVFDLSLSVFLTLIKAFRAPLKPELEVLFNEIYLYLLEFPQTTYRMKHTLLDAFTKIVQSPQILIDIWVNYDCEVGMVCVYERLAYIACKCARGNGVKVGTNGHPLPAGSKLDGISVMAIINSTEPIVVNERKYRVKGLRCTLAMLLSMSEWLEDATVTAASNSAIADYLRQARTKLITKSTAVKSVESNEESPDSSRRAYGIPVVLDPSNAMHSMSMLESPSTRTANNIPSLHTLEDSEKVNKVKSTVKQAIVQFNSESPNKAINMLRDAQILLDVQAVAKFLHQTPELNKKAIGEFLGDGKEFNIQCMYAFVDLFDFKSVDFVPALRQFLQAFRLPGEAQKIDRIMEKFSARYCQNNPNIFAKADVAYTLAFSIMMLNTDQHSKSIKKRMTVEEFIRNNRGINDNGDLPDEFLAKIYTQINTNEIVLEEERTVAELRKMTSSVGLAASKDLERQRVEMLRKETKSIEKKSVQLLKKGKDRSVPPFKHATHLEHVKPMFELLCKHALQAVAALFDECVVESGNTDLLIDLNDAHLTVLSGDSNAEIVRMCLVSIFAMLKLTCLLGMAAERDSVSRSLASMCGLENVGALKFKNVAAVDLLLRLSVMYGNLVDDSWLELLQRISELDKHQLVGSGSQVDGDTKPTAPSTALNSNVTSPQIGDVKLLQRRPSFKVVYGALQSQTVAIMVDRVFANSANLNGASIIYFYEALCKVSEREVDESRIFTLQKIVEISYYNMGRIRLEWTQIWRILTAYFSKIGCHQNLAICTYAIDSLRQLGMKFLERNELSQFSSHNEFLKPFEHVMKSTQFAAVKEMVLQAMSQMISARAANIKSGWRSIFVIISRAANDTADPAMAKRAFNLLQLIVKQHPEVLEQYLIDYAACVVEFALQSEKSNAERKDQDEIWIGCIELLTQSAKHLRSTFNATSQLKLLDDEFHLKWFPILSGLSRILRESQGLFLRSKATDVMFQLLTDHGSIIGCSNGQWQSVMKSVILPIFDDLTSTSTSLPPAGAQSDTVVDKTDQSAATMWVQCIRKLLDLFNVHFDEFRDHQDLLDVPLYLICNLISKNSDNMASTGIICFSQMLQGNWQRFNDTAWDAVTGAIETIFDITIPTKLLKFPTSQNSGAAMNDVDAENDATVIASIDVPHAILKCAIHLMVLQMMRDLVFTSDDGVIALISGTTSQQSVKSPVSATAKSAVSSISQWPSKMIYSAPDKYRSRWNAALHSSYNFAATFNGNYELRLALRKSGVVQRMPDLIKQETQALATCLSLSYHLYRYDDQLTFDALWRDTVMVFDKYLEMSHSDGRLTARDITSWSVVVKLAWYEIDAINWMPDASHDTDIEITGRFATFIKHVPALYDYAVKFLSMELKADMREALLPFLKTVGRLLHKTQAV